MAVTIDIYPKVLLGALRETSIFYSLTNRNVNTTQIEDGGVVKMSTEGDVTIRSYDKGSDLEIEDVSLGETQFTINEGDYYNFRVEDVDEFFNSLNSQGIHTSKAKFKLEREANAYLFDKMKGDADASNLIENVDVDGVSDTNVQNFVDAVRQAAANLTANNIPEQGRWLVVTPQESLLLEKYQTETLQSRQTFLNNAAYRAVGFDVFVTNDIETESGGIRDLLYGHRIATSFVDALTEHEVLRSRKRFADIVRGLHIYGAGTAYPEALGVLSVDSETA